MAKFITHRMTLFSLAYCDWYREICKELGITEEKVLAKLHPRYKETKDGVEVGKDRCDRFMFWANHRRCNEEDHYQRLDMVKRYITTIYPRLVREVAKEEAIAQFMKDLGLENLEHEPKVLPHIQDRPPVLGCRPDPVIMFVHDLRKIKKKKKVKENPMQMEFDFGGEFK